MNVFNEKHHRFIARRHSSSAFSAIWPHLTRPLAYKLQNKLTAEIYIRHNKQNGTVSQPGVQSRGGNGVSK